MCFPGRRGSPDGGARVQASARRSAVRLVTAAALLALAQCAGPGGLPARTPAPERAAAVAAGSANVVLVTLDTTRFDHLGIYGGTKASTPNIDRLRDESVVFDAAYASAPLTAPSHASIFSGLAPTRHGVRNNGLYAVPREVPWVPEEASAAGVDTVGFVAAVPLLSDFGFARGFRAFDDRLPGRRSTGPDGRAGDWPERRADEQRALFEDWLAARGPAAGRFLAWVHFFDPHFPYAPPDRFAVRHRDSPYAGEVEFVDEQLGLLFGALRSRGLWESTTIVVVADHGEGLGTHEEWTHGNFLYEETIRVPLIVKPARGSAMVPLAGRRVAEVVRIADLAPTLRRELGLPPAATDAARDLLESARSMAAAGLPAYFETLASFETYGWAPMFGARDGATKWILSRRESAFDLAADPGERSPLSAGAADEATRGARREVALRLRERPMAAAATAGPDEATVRQLESLGYLVGGAAPPGEDWVARVKDLPDPHPLAPLLVALASAEGKLSTGDFDEARREFESVLERDPGNRKAPLGLADALAALGRFREALEVITRALTAHPEDVRSVAKAASLEHRLGRTDDAIARLLGFGNLRADDRLMLADLLLAAGRPSEAAAEADRVISADPTSTRARQIRALAAKQLGDLPGAEAALRAALVSSEDDYYVRRSLARLLVETGRGAEAMVELDRLVAQFDGDPEVRLFRSEAILADGDVPAAVAEFEAAFEIDPRRWQGRIDVSLDEPALRLGLARHLAEGGDPLGALIVLRRGAERRSLDAEGYYLAGDLAFSMGEIEEGIRLTTAGVALAPENPSLLYNLARGQRMAKRDGEARRTLERAVAAGGERFREFVAADPLMAPLLAPASKGNRR